jgi:hypothetical protein
MLGTSSQWHRSHRDTSAWFNANADRYASAWFNANTNQYTSSWFDANADQYASRRADTDQYARWANADTNTLPRKMRLVGNAHSEPLISD